MNKNERAFNQGDQANDQLAAILGLVVRWHSTERRQQELDSLMTAFLMGFKDAAVKAVSNLLDHEDSMLVAQMIIALGNVSENVAVGSRRAFFQEYSSSNNPFVAEGALIALESLEEFALCG